MKIELLTPVHIGTGYDIPLYEWKSFDSRFMRIDFNQLDENLLPSDTALADFDELMTWREGLQETDLSNASLYQAPIAPNVVMPDNPNQIFREQIKSKFNLNPILPGSSVKGAIITAFLYKRYEDRRWFTPTQYGGKELDDRAKNELKNFVRGRGNPERRESDISNRLKIGDFQFLSQRLCVDQAVRKLKNRILYTWVECLSRNGESVTAKISQTPSNSNRAPQTLPLRESDVREICIRCNLFSRKVIEAEVDYFNYINNKYSTSFLPDFYKQYNNAYINSLSDYECLIRIGWGSDKNAISLVLLNSDPNLHFQQNKPKAMRRPKSRWLLRGEVPLGWCKLTFDQSDWRTP